MKNYTTTILTLLLTAVAQLTASATPPNIVFILSDDHRADFLGVTGNPYIQTPNLDKLALDGAHFVNAFATSATCSPSRAAFWTGRHPHMASAPSITHQNNSFLETQTIFPELLKEAGYQTAFLGKWHLGNGAEPHRGFDLWVGWEKASTFNQVLYRNGKEVKTEGFTDDALAEIAADFIRKETSPTQPFFLYVGLRSPHRPFAYPERLESAFEDTDIPKPATFDEDFRESGRDRRVLNGRLNIEKFPMYTKYFKTWDRFIKSYYRSAQSIDDSVGQVLDALDKAGHSDNTIVIYSSDHGYNLGDHGLVEKHFAYEETLRIPFLMRWPNKINPGTKVEGLMSNIDVAPTLLEAAGVAIPDTVQGRSLQPLLESPGKTPDSWREEIFFVFESRDGLIPGQVAVRGDRYKLVTYTDLPTVELYDLETDPLETKNVAADPEYADVLRQMKKRLQQQIEETEYKPRPKRIALQQVHVANNISPKTAEKLSMQYSDKLFDGGGTSVNWQRVEANSKGEFDPEDFRADSGNLSLIAIPIERQVDYDPHVAIWVAPWPMTRMFWRGEELWEHNPRERKPGNLANPPLAGEENTVLLGVEDVRRPFSIYLESPTDTIVLPESSK